ncbi:MAG: protein-glutamate O-methyltransferase CheR [Pseudomonadales bacterium]|nr:protein-glutamate O-methyltransferase CheR [Pseudomonadales bacterium]
MSSARKNREFEMTDRDFDQIRSLASEFTGISLSEHKKEMVYSRLARRLRALEISGFSDYISYLKSNEREELGNFVNSITTNLTSFFRENHHFEYLTSTVIPELAVQHKADKKIRIWSAGCSTGEEPYSIAMTLAEAREINSTLWDTKVLATDLDTSVLNHAKNAKYNLNRVEGIDIRKREKWFDHYKNEDKSVFHVSEKIRKNVTFNQLNLMNSWPMTAKFDVIFCRNVVIYFDKPTQRKLFDRYASLLNEGGYLFIGHSETLHGVTTRFKSLGRTIYRKVH